MYPSIVADFIAEIHLHLALFFCGACGYLFMKRTKDVCPRRAMQPLPKKLSFDSEDVGEKEDKDAHDEAGEADAEEDTLVSEAAVAEPTVETANLAATVEELKPVVAAAAAQEECTEVAAAPQVSERTARILAKKAERKARKAQERLEAQIKAEMEEKTVEIIPAIEAPVADCIPAMAAMEDAKVPLTEEVATVEEVAPAAASVDEASPEEELVPVASTEVVDLVDEETTPSVENMVVAEASPVALEDEEANSMLSVPLATPKSKVEWYTVEEPDHGLCCAEPELSTTWERSSEELEETEGSSCTGGFEEEEQQMQDTTWHKYQSSWHSWKKEPTSFVDPWEMPWDELLHSREEAEEVYSQLYEQIMQAQAAQQPAQFKPVLCEDNQQLYTDGQQFYMLACITEAEGADDGALREVVAITDAQDPLHAQFAAASPAGYVNMSLPDDDVEPEEA